MSLDWDIEADIQVVRHAAAQGVESGTNMVLSEAVRSILEGPKTGRIYRRRGIEHQASAPGEAPASDTGRLAQSGRKEFSEGGLVGSVIFSTQYAAAMEYGTPTILPRPYANPALAKKSEDIQKDIETRIEEALSQREK